MSTPEELRTKLWTALRSDGTVMLGVMGPSDSHKRPMYAQLDDANTTTLWFFGDRSTELAEALAAGPGEAQACFSSKGHDLFACLAGRLAIDTDRARIDTLWNPRVAAWYPQGKDDPRLVLLRFDPAEAEIWEAESGLLASVKALFGADPDRQAEAGKHASVALS